MFSAEWIEDLKYNIKQNIVFDRINSFFELRENKKIIQKAKISFQTDPAFESQFKNQIVELRENGVLYVPNFYKMEGISVEELWQKVWEKGYYCDNVQTWYPKPIPEPLSAFHQSKWIENIIDHCRGYSSPVSITRLYASQNLNNVNGSFLWHHDGLFHYYKALLYLTDVEQEHGPFEYLAGTQQHDWTYYSYTRSRFNEEDFPLAKKMTFTGKAGDLIILNANGIHRAKNPVHGYKRLVASRAFIDFPSNESTDHTEALPFFQK